MMRHIGLFLLGCLAIPLVPVVVLGFGVYIVGLVAWNFITGTTYEKRNLPPRGPGRPRPDVERTLANVKAAMAHTSPPPPPRYVRPEPLDWINNS